MSDTKKIVRIEDTDDITSIVEKIKKIKASVVYVIIGPDNTIFRSQVNIKLVKRSAAGVRKKVILVTKDTVVESIAGANGLQIAHSVNSQPFLPTTEPKVAEGPSSVISEEPVKIAKKVEPVKKANVAEAPKLKVAKDTKAVNKSGSGISVPNFDAFRNKVLLGFVGLVGLIVLWFFAFKIWPKAEVLVKIQTNATSVKKVVNVATSITTTNANDGKVKAVEAKKSKDAEQEVIATGEKNDGKKATGTVKVENDVSSEAVVFEAGTEFDAGGGIIFTADADFTVGPASVSAGSIIPGTKTVAVTAAEKGTDYNVGNSTMDVVGTTGLYTVVSSNINGGTDDIKKVIQQSDIDAAVTKIRELDKDELRKELLNSFSTDDVIILEDTFDVNVSGVTSNPSEGTEAEKGTVNATIQYSIIAIEKTSLEAIAVSSAKLKNNEQLYGVGTSDFSYQVVRENGESDFDIEFSNKAFIGPKLSRQALIDELIGLESGEGEEVLNSKQGIFESSVELSPFYVGSIPEGDKTTITVQVDEEIFTLDDDSDDSASETDQ